MDVFEVPFSEQTSGKTNRMVTMVLLATLTVTAIFVTDLGLINAVGGGLVASAIVFVFPTIMFRAATNQKVEGEDECGAQAEVSFALVLTAMGIVVGVIGSWLAVQGSTQA